jgi:hypothetical protein
LIGGLELCAWALPHITPLSHERLTILCSILPLLTTNPMRKLFHDLYIQLLAPLTVNNREHAIAACTLQGRQELRGLERGYSTHGVDQPVPNSLIDLKSFMKADFDC